MFFRSRKSSKIETSSIDKTPQPLTTIIVHTSYPSLALTTPKEALKSTGLVETEVKKFIATDDNLAKSKQVYSSLAEFHAYHKADKWGYLNYNSLTMVTLPKQNVYGAIAFDGRPFTKIIGPVNADQYEMQYSLILNNQLNDSKPVKILPGEKYASLTTLLFTPKLNMPTLIKEISRFKISFSEQIRSQKNNLMDLVDLFQFLFLQIPQSQKESQLIQSMLILLANSAMIVPQLENFRTKTVPTLFSSLSPWLPRDDNQKTLDIITEYMCSSEITTEITTRHRLGSR